MATVLQNYIFLVLLIGNVISTNAAEIPSVVVGTFPQEVRREFTMDDGLPANSIHAVALLGGKAFAGTSNGLAQFDNGRWHLVARTAGASVEAVAPNKDRILFVSKGGMYSFAGETVSLLAPLPSGGSVNSLAASDKIFASTDDGLFENTGGKWTAVAALNDFLGEQKVVFQIAIGQHLVVGGAAGLFQQDASGKWNRLFPADKTGRSWAPINVRGVAYDSRGRLWFASPQGVGMLDKEWTLFTGSDGLPFNDFTTMAAGEEGVVWFGTRMGAIRFDGKVWEYRQGKRWVPNDIVNGIAVTPTGDAWFATSAGLSLIEHKPMTLAAKAKFYEDQIDAFHRRTPWEYVLEVSVGKPGTTNQFTQRDSDNDGLWTSMYGAGECFAYGATKDPIAKKRAVKAFEALRWLGEVTQGGEHSPPVGYVARTILPTSGPDPNIGRIEGDRQQKATEDSL
ncbi:MAG: hypothetical protein ABIV39_13720, partial [Verrucomicrobiota bacterium]